MYKFKINLDTHKLIFTFLTKKFLRKQNPLK